MALLVLTTAILALGVLGIQADPLKSKYRSSGGSSGSLVPSLSSDLLLTPSLMPDSNAASLSSDGFLEIAARVDINVILGFLRQIPVLKRTVQQVLEEVKALQNKDDSNTIKKELYHLKSDIAKDFGEILANLQSLLSRSKMETLKNIERILDSALDKKYNNPNACTRGLLKEITQQMTEVIMRNEKNLLEQFINKQIRAELEKLKSIIEDNTNLLNEMHDLLPDVVKGTNSFANHINDNLSSAEYRIKSEINATKALVEMMRREVSNQIESAKNSLKAFVDQRLEGLKGQLADVLKGISMVANLVRDAAAKQEAYFNSAVTEQSEIVQVVKKTHHYVQEHASRMEEVAARTLKASRSSGCQHNMQRSQNRDDEE